MAEVRGGMIRFQTGDELAREREELTSEPESDKIVLTALAAHIRDAFARNKRSKLEVDQQILTNRRQIDGIYEADKLAAIKATGGSAIYMLLTQGKCRDAEAWVRDSIGMERSWVLEPTPIPEMPQDTEAMIAESAIKIASSNAMMAGMAMTVEMLEPMVAEEADRLKKVVHRELMKDAIERAERMSDLIEDQQVEGGWKRELYAAVKDTVEYPAGILKGPVYRNTHALSWQMAPDGWAAKPGTTLKPHYMRVHPRDFFPSPNMAHTDDGGDIIERLRYYPREIADLIGVPGYKEEAIRSVLRDYSGGHTERTEIDAEMDSIESKDTSQVSDGLIHCLEYHGYVQGRLLREWGMEEDQAPDEDVYYYVTAWLIGIHVIKAIVNPDQSGRSLYSTASWSPSNDSIWGKGVPQLMVGPQNIANQQARAINNNVAFASGPLVEVNGDKLRDGVAPRAITPWKVIVSKGGDFNTQPAVHYYTPPLIADKLLQVYNFAKKEADDATGIPNYSHGDPNVGGAGNTASGLSMLMSNNARGMKETIAFISSNLIAPRVEMAYYYNMLFIDDDAIKGDCKVRIKGVEAMMMKEQSAIRLMEFLQATNNPVDMQIIGLEGRRNMLKGVTKHFDAIDSEEVFPDDADRQEGEMGMQEWQGAPSPAAPRTLDAAGNPTSGQDVTLFNQKPQQNQAGGAQ